MELITGSFGALIMLSMGFLAMLSVGAGCVFHFAGTVKKSDKIKAYGLKSMKFCLLFMLLAIGLYFIRTSLGA
ncbi:MAG: hypothetical protein H6619_00440 [Deltaproteobacteria bacterium]|nr:hypothetical protein [Deltaproteobacteria bacterium]